MITEEMVRAAWAEFQKAFHDHADTEAGRHEITRRALSAALAAMWQDHVIVPRFPTDMMIVAALEDAERRNAKNEGQSYTNIYQAMVSAPAPTQLSTGMGDADG